MKNKIRFLFELLGYLAFIGMCMEIFQSQIENKDSFLQQNLLKNDSSFLSPQDSLKKQECLSTKNVPFRLGLLCHLTQSVYEPAVDDIVESTDIPYHISMSYINNQCMVNYEGAGVYQGTSYNFSFSCAVNLKNLQNCKRKDNDCIKNSIIDKK